MVTKRKTKKAVAKRKTTAPAVPDRFKKQISRGKASAIDATTSNIIRVDAGKFVIDGTAKGDTLNVVILDFAFEHRYYEGAYNRDSIQSPDCFAVGYEEDDLKPHVNSLKKQNKDCESCEFNEFGSGSGEAKACSNRIRLALVPAHKKVADFLKEEIYTISVPPTSLKGFKNYLNIVNNQIDIPLSFIYTELSLELVGTYSSYGFEPTDSIVYTKPQLNSLETKIEEASEIVLKPYDKIAPQKRKAKTKAKRKGSRLKRN